MILSRGPITIRLFSYQERVHPDQRRDLNPEAHRDAIQRTPSPPPPKKKTKKSLNIYMGPYNKMLRSQLPTTRDLPYLHVNYLNM